jgi:hypothetical protein
MVGIEPLGEEPKGDEQAGLFMVLEVLEANVESSIFGIYPRCKNTNCT